MRRNTDLQVGFLRRLLDRLLDLIVGRALLEADDEIDNGYVARRYTEGHTNDFTVQAGNDLPTAVAAPVDDGITLAAAPRPPRQSFEEGPSTVFWVAVVACTVVIKPSTMPDRR